MQTLKNTEKDNWLNNLRVIATFAVVFLHSVAMLVHDFGKVPDSVWLVSNFYQSCVRFCVPIFVMISGALLLSKDYELWDFLRKKIVRVAIPLFFWSVCYLIVDYIWQVEIGGAINSSSLIWIVQHLQTGAAYHLWYLYMLIGLYLFIPILRVWIRNANKRDIKYFLVIWFATLFIFQPYIEEVIPNIDLRYFTGYVGYLVLGYYIYTFKPFLSDNQHKMRCYRYYPLIFTVLGIVITFLATFVAAKYFGRFVGVFYEYLTPNVFLTSLGVFLLIKQLSERQRTYPRILYTIGDCSFGIYLLHPLILLIFNFLGISGHFIHPIVGPIITVILVFGFSFFIILGIKKFKIGRYIV